MTGLPGFPVSVTSAVYSALFCYHGLPGLHGWAGRRGQGVRPQRANPPAPANRHPRLRGARRDRMPLGVQPLRRQRFETDAGFVLGAQIGGLADEFGQAAVGELAVVGIEGFANLFAVSFQDRIIRARWFAPIQVLSNVPIDRFRHCR